MKIPSAGEWYFYNMYHHTDVQKNAADLHVMT